MDSQKNENLLNLALSTDEQEREATQELNVGYNSLSKTWEVIVKYHGNLDFLREQQIEVEELIAGYALLQVPQDKMDILAVTEQIEYVEKPKSLFFEDDRAERASCLPVRNTGDVSRPSEGEQSEVTEAILTGKGVLLAIIDSGIDYYREEFRNSNGTSKIREIYDQELNTVYTKEQIDQALMTGSREAAFALVPSTDVSGHGTAVAGIASQIAKESELLIVRLGAVNTEAFPRTTQLMRALTYVSQKAVEFAKPVAVNLSFGNTYGPHNGTSLLERFLDNVAEIGRSVICVGSGNEGASGGHTGGRMDQTKNTRVELIVGEYERKLNVQLWKEYTDRVNVLVQSPNGEEFRIDFDKPGKQVYLIQNTRVLLYNGEPAPYSTAQEIYFDLLPVEGEAFIANGVWSFELVPVRIVSGFYNFYLPTEIVRSAKTRFVTTTPEVTLTIPSTASKVITVGAYDTVFEAYADFSGRGYVYRSDIYGSNVTSIVKPDLVAPGVNIVAPYRESGYESFSGTSFATPFVAGAAALLMEWGITNGNDPYLYGEKVKAYLRNGAKELRGEKLYPNDKLGFGALCVDSSIPFL